jgi:hypothetical protein
MCLPKGSCVSSRLISVSPWLLLLLFQTILVSFSRYGHYHHRAWASHPFLSAQVHLLNDYYCNVGWQVSLGEGVPDVALAMWLASQWTAATSSHGSSRSIALTSLTPFQPPDLGADALLGAQGVHVPRSIRLTHTCIAEATDILQCRHPVMKQEWLGLLYTITPPHIDSGIPGIPHHGMH